MEGRDFSEDGGFSHLVAHACWTVADNTVDSPGSVGVTVQGASRVALGQKRHEYCFVVLLLYLKYKI